MTRAWVGCVFVLLVVLASCAPALPPAEPAAQQASLDQAWSASQRHWFHHAPQGTATFGVPYEWFMALPAPEIGSPGLLSDTAYLGRFGFIASPASQPENPDGLPIGFARGVAQIDPRTGVSVKNPATGKVLTQIGLTCAACHTGRIDYHGTTLTIDGSAAMLQLGKLRTAVALAIVRTAYLPGRFARFARGVLGPNPPAEAQAELRKQFRAAVAGVKERYLLDRSVARGNVEEGFGRLDALNRIGNEVFALDMRDQRGRPNRRNYAPNNAPVHFPHIWDATWFGWAQYNGSIQRPMVRNAGEAMGVGAPVNLSEAGRALFNSSVDFPTLDRIERLLSGPYAAGRSPFTEQRFTGLRAPRWPAMLPPIDRERATRGGALYQAMCAGCHLTPTSTPEFWSQAYWQPAVAEPDAPRFLDLPMIPIVEIGTDPAQATVMARRTVQSFAGLKLGTTAYGPALGAVVAAATQHWYDGQRPPLSAARQDEMNGSRPNGVRAPLAYRTRPLDGIWATPPFLHNGSVPSLYDLLSPINERPVRFWLGSRDYDPVHVGYATAAIPGEFLLDTTRPGNTNKGHEFDDRPNGSGVIGRRLSPNERLDVIEFLKTL